LSEDFGLKSGDLGLDHLLGDDDWLFKFPDPRSVKEIPGGGKAHPWVLGTQCEIDELSGGGISCF
jgi:hypothetical protein